VLRKVAQLFGLLAVAAGFLVGVLDVTRSVANNALELTPLGATSFWLAPKQFILLEPAITRNIHPLLWDPLLLNVLLLPTVLVLFVVGTVLLILGKHKTEKMAFPEQV
jgi:hypothetical protein